MAPEVLIVGAGPAGATAALLLARAGVRVRLVDRALFPRPKLCGDTLNPGAMDILGRLGLAGVVRDAAIPLEGMTVTGPGGATVTGRYGPGIAGAALSRAEFDLLLVRAAAAAGVEFEEGVTVVGPLVEGERGGAPRIRGAAASAGRGGTRSEMRAPITIAADGRRSKIAFALGLARHPRWPRRWAIGTYFEGVAGVGALGEMHVRPGHYLGIAPLPGGLANVCLVVPWEAARAGGPSKPERRGHSAGGWGGAMLDEAIRTDSGLRERFASARALSPPVVLGPLAVDGLCRSLPGLLVAGDAAGFIDPMTGDGMRFALRGGELAAAEAIRLLEQGPATLGRLADLLEREFRWKRAFNRAMRRVAGSGAAVRLAARVAVLRPGLVAWAVRYAGDAAGAAGLSRSTIPPAGAPAA